MSGFRDKGPAPKRSDERVRRNEPLVEVTKLDVSQLIQREVEIPTPDENWHAVAREWYESLARTAICVYYEPSDWMMAYVMATNLSRLLKPQVIGYDEERGKVIKASKPLNGSDMGAFIKLCTNLLLTEVDRRRAGIEIQRAVQLADLEALASDEADNVVSFEEARAASVGN